MSIKQYTENLLKMKTKDTIYTQEFVRQELKSILDMILSDKSIVYIGEVFENKDYSRQRYSEWKESYKDDEEITDTIDRITNILESRVNVGALRNNLNSTVAIFNLKNNYGWKDKTESEVKNTVKFEQLSDEDKNKIDNLIG